MLLWSSLGAPGSSFPLNTGQACSRSVMDPVLCSVPKTSPPQLATERWDFTRASVHIPVQGFVSMLVFSSLVYLSVLQDNLKIYIITIFGN